MVTIKPKRMISPARAASILGVHPHTIRAWCKLNIEGKPSRLSVVQQNPVTGYWWVSIDEILAMRKRASKKPL